MTISLNETDDFGFSLVSETELKAYEEILKERLEQTSSAVVQTEQEYKNKIDGLMAMIMPLLNNLSQDPQKEYILWPNRVEKIQAFKTKLVNYVNS
jgi:hypothetical protein